MAAVKRRRLRRSTTVLVDRDTTVLLDNILTHARALGTTKFTTREYVVGRAVRLLASMTGAPFAPSQWAADWLIFPDFAQAAAAAAIFDVKARMVATNAGAVAKERATRDRLDEVTAKLVTHLRVHLADGEGALLMKLAKVRDKVLHAQWDAMTGSLKSLKDEIPIPVRQGTGVVAVNLKTGKTSKVRGAPIDRTSLSGWLLEAQQQGAFAAATSAFAKGTNILAKLGMLQE